MKWARVGLAGLVVCAIAVAACGGGSKSLTPNASTGTTTTASGGKGDEQASAGDVPNYTPTGQLIADDGFRPDKNGFTFPNYGNDGNPKNLGPAEMQALFGDQVCASGSGESCQLIPPAQQWMDEQNKGMNGGHCEGFSVAAIRLFKGSLKTDQFGGAGDPFGLQSTAPLQSEIAKAFVTQYFPSVLGAQVKGDPNSVLDKLTEALKSKSEYYTVGIYKTDPNTGQRSGGHAVTPYAVEDKGGGQQAILIYDNNYPGKTRAIMVDRNADTWTYTAQTNPNDPADEYKGDAKTQTLELDPESPGDGQQPCPFCNGQGGESAGNKGSKGSTLPSAEQYTEIALEASDTNHAHLLISDDQGHKIGFENGKFVEDMSGAKALLPQADQDWLGTPEPIYRIPVGTKVTVAIDGSSLQGEDTENVTVTAPGIYTTVDNLKMAQGQKDELSLNGDGSALGVKTDPNQTDAPVLGLGFSADTADYGFAITNKDLTGGSSIAFNLDQKAGKLNLDTSGTKGNGTYAVSVLRETDQGTENFKHDNLQIGSGETASLEYSKFTKNGEPIKLDISGNGQSRSEELTPDQG